MTVDSIQDPTHSRAVYSIRIDLKLNIDPMDERSREFFTWWSANGGLLYQKEVTKWASTIKFFSIKYNNAKYCPVNNRGITRLWLWGDDQQFAIMLLICFSDLVVYHTVPPGIIDPYTNCP